MSPIKLALGIHAEPHARHPLTILNRAHNFYPPIRLVRYRETRRSDQTISPPSPHPPLTLPLYVGTRKTSWQMLRELAVRARATRISIKRRPTRSWPKLARARTRGFLASSHLIPARSPPPRPFIRSFIFDFFSKQCLCPETRLSLARSIAAAREAVLFHRCLTSRAMQALYIYGETLSLCGCYTGGAFFTDVPGIYGR